MKNQSFFGWVLVGFTIVALCACSSKIKQPVSVSMSGSSLVETKKIHNKKSLEYFNLASVRLLPSPFKHAQDINVKYINSMDVNRLLAPYLREAGLDVRAENYGNWESQGLDGHIGGHYLSALSLAYAATGDVQFKKRLQYMLDELERAQMENGNGYIGGIPNGKAIWNEIRDGKINAELFNLNRRWVPWYNLHKTFSGLRDAYVYAGSEQALSMLIALSNWTVALVQNLSDAQIQQMLKAEHGGMNEVFADLYLLTRDKRYLTLANQFSDHRILDPLMKSNEGDELSFLVGMHANTQIPKVIGFKRIADVSERNEFNKAARVFWRDIVENRSIAIGGNSVSEHFHSATDFSVMTEAIEGPETCNTYNMLKLSKLLFADNRESAYIDFYERALYNHILSSQHPETGGLVYFTPVRPQHYRVYSQVDTSMWCCVGSGIENHFKYGELIYAHNGNAGQGKELFVNLFIPSTLDWKHARIKIRQENSIPDSESTKITIESDAKFALNIRHPVWVKQNTLSVTINGAQERYDSTPGSYFRLERSWESGDVIEIELPMHLKLEALNENNALHALIYGPVVLSQKVKPFKSETINYFADESRMGHIASGPLCSIVDAPVLMASSENILSNIRKLPGEQLQFGLGDVAYQLSGDQKYQVIDKQEPLIPFFRLHESRYMLYWSVGEREYFDALSEKARAEENAKLALDAQTIDHVTPGQQQPESDHFFQSENSEAGIHLGRHWRHAAGWFSYQLRDPNHQAKLLRITYSGGDSGRRFEILINGEVIAAVESKGKPNLQLFDVDYLLPKELIDKSDGTLVVKFQALENSIAGGVFGVRLMRGEPTVKEKAHH